MEDDKSPQKVEKIRTLNDHLRTTLQGQVNITSGVQAMGGHAVNEIFDLVRNYSSDKFTPDNDPYGEHDFGSIDFRGDKLFWKIDYYDSNLEYGSENPADPNLTSRVLTIMKAEEY